MPEAPIVDFLPVDSELMVNFVALAEVEAAARCKSKVPSIKDFEFIKVLGKGGFATVYMVRMRSTGRLYAMKTVKKASVKLNG
jgi:serine/threonine protein kinase